MATVNNVRVNNYNLNLTDSTRAFEAIWELTRAMKKAGWKFKASSNGTTKISNSDPAADNWGSGTVSHAGAAAASIAAPTRGRATVTGLTGIGATDKGKFLLISGAATGANNNQHQIEEVLSATSVRIDARNFAVASDANNGSLTWSIRDPLGDAYSSFAASLDANIAWWCAQGPSVLRIPITAASIGTFVVGENLVQTTTGAEGELIGYTYNRHTASGWLVVAPRLRGTGSGVYGWQTGSVVTGSESAATVTQSGTALDYVYEVVFIKPTANTTIQIFVGQFETVAESAQLFSFCATQAGATATVHPGGGGTGNAFGAAAWVMWGTGTTAALGSRISGTTTTPVYFLNSQYICVDAIPEQNYTADGSWSIFILTTQSLSTNPLGGILYGFHRLNDVEEGELSPYVTINPGGTKTLHTNARTSAGTLTTIAGQTDMCSFNFFDVTLGTTRVCFNGWRSRGVSVYPTNANLGLDQFTEFQLADLACLQSALGFVRGSTVPRVVSSASPYAKPRGLVQLVYAPSPVRMFKGTFKWLYWVNGDQVTDIYGTDPAWVQLSSNLQGSLVLGPSDGTAWFLSQ